MQIVAQTKIRFVHVLPFFEIVLMQNLHTVGKGYGFRFPIRNRRRPAWTGKVLFFRYHHAHRRSDLTPPVAFPPPERRILLKKASLSTCFFWRRCRDLNPSTPRGRLPDFESGPFNHLGTSPYQRRFSGSSLQRKLTGTLYQLDPEKSMQYFIFSANRRSNNKK